MDIDFVILWVDGNDPTWLAEKQKYQSDVTDESNSVNRYRDWGLLPYWFRTVEQFTPWVHRIWFVTWGHVPAFLNTDAPKLKVIRHDEFIPAEYLPTFSSHAIEMNLHRIPGLSEHFVYFNDDMFMLRPFSPEDFFRDGLPCTNGSEIPIELKGRIGVWQHAAVNDLGIINRHFPKREAVRKHGKKYVDKRYRWQDNVRTTALEKLYPDYFTGFRNLHAPAAYLKQTFQEIWAAEPELLDETSKDRFRTERNVNQWVALWWQIASGQFSPAVNTNFVGSVAEDNLDKFIRVITTPVYDFVCINDPDKEIDFQKISAAVRDAFEVILPEKSNFEL